MGNSNSQMTNAELLDSRVIKISESVAKKLFMQPNVVRKEGVNSSKKSNSSNSYTPEAPIPRVQAYREDGNYVDDALYKEFQKQEVLDELQFRALQKELDNAFESFIPERPKIQKLSLSAEQKHLSQCLANQNGTPLKCHAEIVDFTTFAKQAVQP